MPSRASVTGREQRPVLEEKESEKKVSKKKMLEEKVLKEEVPEEEVPEEEVPEVLEGTILDLYTPLTIKAID